MPRSTVGSVVLALALLAVGGLAHADGTLGIRGIYYQENSTRVAQPMLDAELDAGKNGRIDTHFLVDSITAASVAAAAPSGIVQFSERRFEFGGGYTHAFQGFRLGASGRISFEPDYVSRQATVHGELDLFDKNLVLGFAVGRGFDTAKARQDAPNGGREESLQTGITSLSLTQILSPVLVGSLTYDFLDSHGYHGNVYRQVAGAGAPQDERVPELRLRHAVQGSLRGLYFPTDTIAAVSYRLYADDWGIIGHTPEVRVIQRVRPGLDLRMRYRYHTQSGADFYQETYNAMEILDPDLFITDDVKLGALSTHLFGGQVAMELGVLGVGGTMSEARVDLVVERVLQSAIFGDAWVAEVGLTMPLIY